jgi:hypothetical protein
MPKRFLDPRPQIPLGKAIVTLVHVGPGLSLLLTMLYFGVVYLLVYIANVSHPLLTLSLGARSAFGFEPVHSSVVLNECAGVNSTRPACPPNFSDYYLSVLISYMSPLNLMQPELSITYVLMVVSMVSLIGQGLWGRFGALRATKGYDSK